MCGLWWLGWLDMRCFLMGCVELVVVLCDEIVMYVGMIDDWDVVCVCVDWMIGDVDVCFC